MKKISILSGILFFFTIANGQINKGTYLIGGQASSSRLQSVYYNENYSSKNTNVSISISKSFKENSLYGLSLGYMPNSVTNPGSSTNSLSSQKSKNYNASLFYRKYKKLVTGLYFFNEVGVGLSYSHNNYDTNDTLGIMPYRSNAYTGSLYYTPGVAYRVCRKIDLELLLPNLVSLSYSTGVTKTNYSGNYIKTGTGDTFSLNTNANITTLAFGVKFIL